MAIVITPKRKANNSLHTGVRNVSAQLIRRVAAVNDSPLQETDSVPPSTFEDLITMTGKGCRFSNFRPIRLRLYLRIPPDAEVATIRTTFQNVRMYVRISIGVIGRDDIILEKEIGILVDDAMPQRLAAPEADDEVARLADKKRRLPWDIDIEGEFDGYDDGVGDRIEADPAPQYGGLASSNDTTLGTGSSSHKYDEAFASSSRYDTSVMTVPVETDAWSIEDREEGVEPQSEEAPPPISDISEDTHMPAPPYMGEHDDGDPPMTRSRPRQSSHGSLLDQDQTYVLALQAYQRQQMEDGGAQRTFDLQDLSHHDDDDTTRDDGRVPSNGAEGDLPAYGDVNSSISVGYGGIYPPMNRQEPHQQAVHHHHDRDSPPPPPSPPLPPIPTNRLSNAVSTVLTGSSPAESTIEPPPPPPPIDFVRVGEHGRLIAVESVPPPYRE